MGLSQTVTGLCSIHADVQYALHPVTSWEAFCPDNLRIVSSLRLLMADVVTERCAMAAARDGPLEGKMGQKVD